MIFEIAPGTLLLVSQVSWLAAWRTIALLIAVFPANIYERRHGGGGEAACKATRSAMVCIVGFGLVGGVNGAGEPPRVLQQVKVYSEPGRFAGWPANHGIWSWGDEILVGFSRGYDKDNGADYHIDPDRPEDFLLARSKDGGATWSIEEPKPPGALVGTRGMRHAAMPPGIAEERPVPAPRTDRFHSS